jgi:integrase/recombinase XerD
MATHNADNERIKREYFIFLKEAKRQAEDSVDAVAKALARFETDTRHRDFKSFHHQQAIAFKRRLADKDSQVTGEKLSKATMHATLGHLRRFFEWLALQPGYKSKLKFTDAEYFSQSQNDTRVATTRRERPAPTLEQVRHTLVQMPTGTEIERRDRAVMAFTLLTGARDSALATMKLKHVNLSAGCVFQDARDVKTKFSKSFTTYFFPVGDDVRRIVADWVTYLRETKLWGNDDPLFPATKVELGALRQFHAAGIERRAWTTASPIREIFKQAFAAAGLPYFNPHSLRRTLVHLGERRCQSPEEFKAWSQNMGHDGVLTTFNSYGNVDSRRQGEIIQALTGEGGRLDGNTEQVAEAVVRRLLRAKLVTEAGAGGENS